jgi:REP element-mobilizing transposase RayT
MSYDPNQHHRRSIRLPSWDYRRPGTYFITVCTHRRIPLFGTVVDGRVRGSAFGRVVAEEWHRTEQVRDNVTLDAFVVMPDHMHGVVVITTDPENGDSSRGSRGSSSMNPYYGHPNRTFGGAMAGSLSTIMRQFKSMVTTRA